MKPPALEYRFAGDDAWNPMPDALAHMAFSPKEIATTGIDAYLPPVARLFAGQPIEAVSASGRGGFIRIAR